MSIIVKKKEDISVDGPSSEAAVKIGIVDVISRAEGAPFTAGICEIWAGEPPVFNPTDHVAVYCMLDGRITLQDENATYDFASGDVACAPLNSRFSLTAPEYGRFFLVTYPHWR